MYLKSIEQVKEIYHFTQDDLMTEDVFILDCHTSIFVWVGQQVDVKVRLQALDVGEVTIYFSTQLRYNPFFVFFSHYFTFSPEIYCA